MERRSLSFFVAFAILFVTGCADDGGGPVADGGPGGCPADESFCRGLCVDTQSDPMNCGTCGTTCGEGSVCSFGSCETSCSIVHVACSGACVDVSSDPAHCGMCHNACAAGEVCMGGTCETCSSRETLCSGACTDLMTDRNNCGACGMTCPLSLPFCSEGTCTRAP